jgi:excisionase family DNA binding protein
MHDVLTEHEAADYLRATVAEVMALLEAGEIRGRRISASWRIHR